MKQFLKVVWEVVSIPLEALRCLLTLAFLPILSGLCFIGTLFGGFSSGFMGGLLLVRNFGQLKKKMGPFAIWCVGFMSILFLIYKGNTLLGTHIFNWQADSGAAIAAVLFRRYLAKPLISKGKAALQRGNPGGEGAVPVTR
jgi:hypothetical protein